MPNIVLFDESISSTSKLVFVLISSLCAKRGYCFATNEYMAKKMGLTVRTIQRSILELQKYLVVKIENNKVRKIRIADTIVAESTENDSNDEPTVTKMSYYHDKNVTHNNTSVIIQENTIQSIEGSPTENVAVIKPTDTKPTYGKPEINELFDYWESVVGYRIGSNVKQNRFAVANLLKKHSADDMKTLVRAVATAQRDRYAPRIEDFVALQSKMNKLIVWIRQQKTNSKHLEIV